MANALLNASHALLSAADETGAAFPVSGGYYNWVAHGTWDGATATLQWSPDEGTTWIGIDEAALTENGGLSGIPISDGHVRVAISGAGGSTSVSSKLGRV